MCWCSLYGTTCLLYISFSLNTVQKNSVAAFVVGKRKLSRLALLAFPHDSKQLLMDL